MAGMTDSYFDGLMTAARDSDRVDVVLDGSKDLGGVDLALVPRRGTRLATFVAAQRPSSYALLDKLPAGTSPIVMAGHLVSGPYRQGLLELMTKIYGASLPGDGAAAMAELMKAASGEIAMRMTMAPGKPMELVEVFGLDDAARFDGALGKMLGLFAKPRTLDGMGTKSTFVAIPSTPAHDGVTPRGLDVTYDFTALPAATRTQMAAMFGGGTMHMHVATFDKLAGVAMGVDSAAMVGAVIDTARGHAVAAAPSAAVTALLAGSRARQESVAMVMDLGVLMGAGAGDRAVMMSLGFAGGAFHVHLALPTATVKALTP
jgi:hypothetical protein